MLHPSYLELMEAVNKNVPEGEEPIVQSRYSIVLGTAKRARQLVAAGVDTLYGEQRKPLSIAVEELWSGKIQILGEGEEDEEQDQPAEALEAEGEPLEEESWNAFPAGEPEADAEEQDSQPEE